MSFSFLKLEMLDADTASSKFHYYFKVFFFSPFLKSASARTGIELIFYSSLLEFNKLSVGYNFYLLISTPDKDHK